MTTSSELTSEDYLRLNVLVTQAEAVRIDEQALRVIGRAGGREWAVQLHPRGAQYRYLQSVRRLLSELVLGQPSGFPVYIRRWNRAGALTGINARQLLKLGEPEAVRAVARLPHLDVELAELAWWAERSPQVARALLAAMDEAMPLARRLAAFLAEHLAFEDDSETQMEIVGQLVRPGLLDETTVATLWSRRALNPPYRIGFLQRAAGALPEPELAHPLLAVHGARLCELCLAGNAAAKALHQLLDAQGQTFLRECRAALDEASDQHIVGAAANALSDYLGLADRQSAPRELRFLIDAVQCSSPPPPYAAVAALDGELAPLAQALRVLGGVSERLFYDLFARTTATGSLLRRKLMPLTQPLIACIDALRPEDRRGGTAATATRRARAGRIRTQE